MISLQKCNTITELVDYSKSIAISHSKMHIKSKISDSSGNNIIMNYESLLNKYRDYLQKIIITRTLTDIEYAKYKFQPKLMSFELYGTTELWSSILSINNLTSASEFTLQKVKLFTYDIFDVINEILILEDDEIKANNAEVGL